MTELSNGHKLEFLAASGALAFDGRGWWFERLWLWLGLLDPSKLTIVLKTLTFSPCSGHLRWYNPWRVVKWLGGWFSCEGHVNSIALTNPGFLKWFLRTAGRLNPKWKFIISIASSNIREIKAMAHLINLLPKNLIVAVEYNPACLNSEESRRLSGNVNLIVELTTCLSEECQLPVIIKVGYHMDYLQIVSRLRGIAQAVSIDSVPWKVVFPNEKSPLSSDFGDGAVSGKLAQPYTWIMIRNLVAQDALPVIGCSVWNFPDLETLKKMGVKAIAFGSVIIRYWWYPCLPNKYIALWRERYGNF